MVDTPAIEDLDRLVLVWLLVPRKQPRLKSLASLLAPFLLAMGGAPESVARQSLARLKARGHVEEDSEWTLSPSGRQKALSTLGVPALPPRVSWKWVQSLLVARGHGDDLTPALLRRVGNAEGLAARVIEKHHRIPEASTLAQAGHALAWRELGIESTRPFTLKAVLAHIVQKTCGVSVEPRDAKTALAMLAAAALEAPRGDASLRAALIQRWMHAAGRGEGPVTPLPPAPLSDSEAPVSAQPPVPIPDGEPVSLPSFSARALDAARASRTGRWGEHKVFVSHAWDEYRRRDDGPTMDLGAFKDMLVRANQAGLLSLSRADLVEEMNADDVKRSEIASLGATFHFVRVDG